MRDTFVQASDGTALWAQSSGPGDPPLVFCDGPGFGRVFPLLKRLIESLPRLSALASRWALRSDLALQYALRFELNRELLMKEDLLPYFDHLSKMSPVAFVRTLASLAQHTAWDHLPKVDVPTLIIGGDRDRFTPLWLSKQMA